MSITLTTDARGVAKLTLNRSEKHNALSEQMLIELTETGNEIAARSDIRVVILDAAGPTFCAGGDLRWMQAQIAAGTEQRRAAAMTLAGMLERINTLPQPVIGRIQGNAFGGGVGMACVCDVTVSVDTAKFGLTETRLGLIPATIGPYVVARMGEANARQVFMSSRIFDASEAQRLGIVSRVVTADVLDAAVEAEVLPYLSCAPQAVAAAKAQVRDLGMPITPQVVAASIDRLVDRWDGEEAAQGLAAFFAKTPPPWVG